MDDKKAVLPFGWVVKQSKTYPDRIYYFNINTGASSWEFPDLLQHYVGGQADTTVSPVLSATSITADVISPEIPASTSHQTPQLPSKHKVSASSHIKYKGQNMSTSIDNNSLHKLSSKQVPSITGNKNRNTTNSHTLSHLKCNPREPVIHSGKNLKVQSGTVDNNYLNQVKSHHQPCPKSDMKNESKYANSSLKSVSGIKNDLQSDKKSFSNSRHGHPYKRDTDKGVLRKKTSAKSQQTSKLSDLPIEIVNVANKVSNSDTSNKKSKISPIRFPEKSETEVKSLCSNVSTCVQKKQEISESVIKDSRNVLNVRKHFSESSNKTNAVRIISQDLQTLLKRRKSGTEGHCSSINKLSKKEVPSEDVQSTNKKIKQTKVKNGENSQSECKQVGEDTRKVVRSAQSHYNITNNEASQASKKLTPSDLDSRVSKCIPVPSPCGETTPASDVESDFDRNNNTEYKLFIGDKDKLLSIQSWINNLQDRAGSESPSVDSYSQVSVGQVNESVDSGYVTNTTIKTCSPPDKGWPVELKESEVKSKQVIDMEVDECHGNEELQVGRSGERLWQFGKGVGEEVPSGEVGMQHGDSNVELMDWDEVLIEVRQQVSGSGDHSAGSFLTYTDNFTPIKATNQIITVVVDTNILISNLKLFEMLLDYQLQGRGLVKLCLYIPWIVLCELDALKEKVTSNKRNLHEAQSKARAAISLLKALFSKKHPRVKGQTPREADEASENFRSSCNDDNILQACLQCQKNGLCVVLLTNDNNLINKAFVSKLSAYNANDILSGLKDVGNEFPIVTSLNLPNDIPEKVGTVECKIPTETNHEASASFIGACGTEFKVGASGGKSVQVLQDKIPVSGKQKQTCLADKILKEEKTCTVESLVDDMYCKMKAVLFEALGKILEVEMKNAYDDIWTDIVYRKPPWDLKAILECWKKHWMAVLGFVFPRYLSKNVDNLLSNIRGYKGTHTSVNVVKDVCEDSSEILEKAVLSNMYSARITEISETVTLIKDLCDKIPTMTAATVPDLDQYLNTKTNTTTNDGCSTRMTSSKSAVNIGQCSTTTTVINTQQPPSTTHISDINPHSKSCDGNQKPLQSGSQENLSSQNSQNGSQICMANSSKGCDKTVADAAQSDTSSELVAGEYLSQIWRCIYSYCEEFYRTISTSTDDSVLRNIEPVLKVLVSTCLELRKYYAGLLELPVSDLSNREEEFTALSQICNSFFSKLNVQENVPGGEITPLQLLVLYSKPVYRETLSQFLSKLDEMLKMMYQCLHKLCPDD